MNKFFWTLIICFVILTGLILAAAPVFTKWGIYTNVCVAGNLILAAVTVLSYLFGRNGLKGKSQFAFVRQVYLSTFLKLFVCAIAIIVYAFLNKGNLSLPTIVVLFILYIIYSVLETRYLMKAAKNTRS